LNAFGQPAKVIRQFCQILRKLRLGRLPGGKIKQAPLRGFRQWRGEKVLFFLQILGWQEPEIGLRGCRFSFTISLRGFHTISARYLRKWRGFLLCDFNFIMDFNRF